MGGGNWKDGYPRCDGSPYKKKLSKQDILGWMKWFKLVLYLAFDTSVIAQHVCSCKERIGLIYF